MGTSLGSIFIDLKINLKALDEANKKIKRFSKTVNVNMRQASTSVKKMERSWRRSFRRMSNDAFRLGGILTASLTAPLGLAFKSVIGGAAFDELEFVKLRKLLPVTDERAAEIREGLREIVRRVPLAAHEISNVGAEAARLGVAEKYIENFTEVMGKMSFATVLGSTDAAIALARFSNIVTLPLDQIERVGSAVVHLGNNFAANEREITKMALRLGALKAMAGATIPQILGLSAAFPAVGLFPELVGTSMGRIATKLQNAIKQFPKMRALMAALTEKTPEQFQTDFAADNIKEILNVAEGLQKGANSGLQFAEMLRAIGLDGYRISIVMAFMAGNTKLFRDAIDKASLAFEQNIQLQKEFDRFMNTLSNQWRLFANQMSLIKIQLGDQFLPLMRKIVKLFLASFVPVLEVAVGRLSGLSDKTRLFILSMGLVLGIMGPVVLALGILVKVILILGTTIGLIMAGLLAVPLILAGVIIYWDELGAAIDSFGNMLKSTWKRIKGFFGELKSNFVRDMKVLWGHIVKIGTNIWRFYAGVWTSIGEFFYNVFGPIIDAAIWIGEKINNVLADKEGKSLQQQIIAAKKDAKETIDNRAAKLEAKRAKNNKKFVEGLQASLPETSKDEIKKMKEAEGIQKRIVKIQDDASKNSPWTKFWQDVEKRKKELKKQVDKASELDPFDPTANQNLDVLAPEFQDLARGLVDEFSAAEAGNTAAKTFSDSWEDTLRGEMTGTLSEIFEGELDSMASIFKSFLRSLINSMTQTWSRFLAEDIVGGLRKALDKSGGSGWLDGLFKTVKTAFKPTLPSSVIDISNKNFVGPIRPAGPLKPDGSFAKGGVMVGEEGPEMVMNAKATKSYGRHLAALNYGMDRRMGENVSMEQNFNFEAGVTQDQLGVALQQLSERMYQKMIDDLKTPDSHLRRTIRGTR